MGVNGAVGTTGIEAGRQAALRMVKVAHTIVWALLVAVILGIPVAAWYRRFDIFLVLAAIILVEIAVLAVNGLRCPLTAVAARYTDDRQDNFDIYLPLYVARYNKQIFGTIFAGGLLFGLVRALT